MELSAVRALPQFALWPGNPALAMRLIERRSANQLTALSRLSTSSDRLGSPPSKHVLPVILQVGLHSDGA